MLAMTRLRNLSSLQIGEGANQQHACMCKQNRSMQVNYGKQVCSRWSDDMVHVGNAHGRFVSLRVVPTFIDLAACRNSRFGSKLSK